MEKMKKILYQIRKKGLYPDVKVLDSACDPVVMVDGKEILMFGSYNYLGLANHPEVKKAAIEAIKKYGVASGGVRLISGTFDIHVKLERELAAFTYHEDAMTTGTGFGTNIGIIPAIINLLGFKVNIPLLGRKDIIFSDELNHASIIDGCRLARTKVEIYKHNNMHDLEVKLSKYKRHRKLIITDGVFSMDGDIVPLDKIIKLADQYNALTMVDDAHAIGVLGENGGGTAEHFGLQGEIDINMGTMSKGLGCAGGFVSGKKELIDFFRVACRSYVFSDSVPPVIASAILKVLDIIRRDPSLREKMKENAHYFRSNMKKLGFDTLNSTTQIVPWLIGDDVSAIRVSNLLFENDIFAPAIRWPAVPKGEARIRFNLMSSHTKDQIDKLLNTCEVIGKKIKLI